MAERDRQLTEEQRLRNELSESKVLLRKEISRRGFLVKVAFLVGAVAGVAGGGLAGKKLAEDEVRGQLLLPGDLSPERRKKLESAGYFIYEPEGETIASLEEVDSGIPEFPLEFPEGQNDFRKAPSKRKWIAVKQGADFYSPIKAGATPKDLDSQIRSESSAVNGLDSGLQAVQGEAVDLLGLDHNYRLRHDGKSLFSQIGFVPTATRVKIDGKDFSVAIGKPEPEDPLSYIFVDLSTQNPTPPQGQLVAVALTVAK